MDFESPVNITAPNPNVGRLELAALLGGGRLRIRGNDDRSVAEFAAGLGAAVLSLGGNEYNGSVRIKDAAGTTVVALNGRDGDIRLFNDDGDQTLLLDGAAGDIRLTGGDAAEDFEVVEDNVRPGSVMVIAEHARLAVCRRAYDRRVAGVVSGAGPYRPGVVLGSSSGSHRLPVALAGTVCCLADATSAQIEVGDLLTSSSNPGHAMRASSPGRAFGAVLGKALEPLPDGTGLIPILVALQ